MRTYLLLPRWSSASLLGCLFALLVLSAPQQGLAQPSETGTSVASSTSWQGPHSSGARIELSLLAVPFGAAAGNLVCGLAYCNSARPWAGANLAGAAVATTAAALLTRDKELRFSTAQAVEGGAAFGLVTPLYGLLILRPRQADRQATLGSMLAGEVLGAGTGLLLETRFKPASGTVALANSGGLWLSAMTFLLALNVDSPSDAGVRGMGAGLLVSEALGIAGGAYFGAHEHATRAQAGFGDLGAALGAGAVPLMTWLLMDDGASRELLLSGAALGIAGGFLGGYALARRFSRVPALARLERWSRKTQLSAAPSTRGGGMLQISGRF